MSDFETALAEMRQALYRAPRPLEDDHGSLQEAPSTLSPHTTDTDLPTRFARELESLRGSVIDVPNAEQAAFAIAELARSLELRSVAIGESLRIDLTQIVQKLREYGIDVFSVARVPEERRAELRVKLAECSAGLVEADCAVAASGTLVFVPTPERPRSLSLVPPVSIVLLEADRIVPDLAAVVSVLGSDAMRANPVAFVTGPSRTADIEKRIVLGAHGPKALYVVMVRSLG